MHAGADPDAGYEDPSIHALAHIRRESLDVFNRIHSVAEDVQFVRAVAAAYDLPILRAYLVPRPCRQPGSQVRAHPRPALCIFLHFSVFDPEKRAKGLRAR